MTDIYPSANQTWQDMRVTGGYNVLKNNCQHFVGRLFVHIENQDSAEVNRRNIERTMMEMLELLSTDSNDDELEEYRDSEENLPWQSGSARRTNPWW
jgi:hypothetical protein